MKKILCMLTALACAFSIVSCDALLGGNGGDGVVGEIGNPLEEVVLASAPTKIVTKVSYVYPAGNNKYGWDLDGDYTLEIDGNNSIFKYDFNTTASIEEGADGSIKTVKGTIYFKDGMVLLAEGDAWESISAQTVNRKFTLVKNRFKTYEKSADEKTLTATITGSNIDSVIGYTLSAEGDITVVVTTDGIYMRSVTISYKSQDGANVTISTSYSYNQIILDFPSV